MTNQARVLLIVTSHDRLGETGQKTGFWLEELAEPYYEFIAAGATVDIASLKGGNPPADPKSSSSPPEVVARFLADSTASRKLQNSLKLTEIKEPYDAYFVVGGHGVSWDLASSPDASRLLGGAFDEGRVVAAVCHGPAALVNVSLADGSPLVRGRRVAGFSDAEESAVGLTDVVPFLIESRMRELGAKYEKAEKMWQPHVVRDGRLVTGQNPASSRGVAIETLAAIAETKAKQ